MNADRITSREVLVTVIASQRYEVEYCVRWILTDEPVSAHTTSGNDNKSKAENGIECEPLSPRDLVMPGDDAW
jgi:hypothetical protein